MSRGILGKGELIGRSSGLGLMGKPGLLGFGKFGRPLDELIRELRIEPKDPEVPTFGGDLVASSRGTATGLAEEVASGEERVDRNCAAVTES